MNTRASTIDGPMSLLRELRNSDPDTGLLTFSNLYEALLREVARSERYGNMLSLLHIKVPALVAHDSSGDDPLLLQLASRLADNVRNIDYAARWSITEFLVVLPETDNAGAQQCADKISSAIEDLLESHDKHDTSVTIEIVEWQSGDDVSRLLARTGIRA